MKTIEDLMEGTTKENFQKGSFSESGVYTFQRHKEGGYLLTIIDELEGEDHILHIRMVNKNNWYSYVETYDGLGEQDKLPVDPLEFSEYFLAETLK